MSSVKLNEEEKRLLHNAWHHFLTITHHKLVVMEGCFKVGLFKQGLLHDLSKYSWEEFKTGVKYYQGTRSPNAAEKDLPEPGVPKISPLGFLSCLRSTMIMLLDSAFSP